MSSISPDDIRWNDEARAKILADSDNVLREAVLDVAGSHADGSWEDAFAELNARLKDRFIDFEPGPDLRRYAEVIVAGEIEGAADADADAGDDAGDDGESTAASTDDASSGGAYAERPADQIAADAGAAEPATPETDGSGSGGAGSDDSGSDDPGSNDSGSDDSGSVMDGNATSDVTSTDDPTD